jgi:hypothetical protein
MASPHVVARNVNAALAQWTRTWSASSKTFSRRRSTTPGSPGGQKQRP